MQAQARAQLAAGAAAGAATGTGTAAGAGTAARARVGDGPEFPAYVLPRNQDDAAANTAAMPSPNKPDGDMSPADMALRPPMKDQSEWQFPVTIGGENGGEYPETEGYHPPGGYFKQSYQCDALMRLWFNKCAFVDAPGSMFWKNHLSVFPTKEEGETSSTFVGNILANQAAELYLGENSNYQVALRMGEDGEGGEAEE